MLTSLGEKTTCIKLCRGCMPCLETLMSYPYILQTIKWPNSFRNPNVMHVIIAHKNIKIYWNADID